MRKSSKSSWKIMWPKGGVENYSRFYKSIQWAWNGAVMGDIGLNCFHMAKRWEDILPTHHWGGGRRERERVSQSKAEFGKYLHCHQEQGEESALCCSWVKGGPSKREKLSGAVQEDSQEGQVAFSRVSSVLKRPLKNQEWGQESSSWRNMISLLSQEL